MARYGDHHEWYASLQKALERTVKDAYAGKWKDNDNRGLACDIFDIEGVLEIIRLEFHDEEKELWIYARIGQHITEAYQIQEPVYRMLGMASEDYLVLVPYRTRDGLQFWFMMGTKSHGHIGRVIVTKEDNPHIHMW